MKNPSRDFSVISKEFTIPTKVFQVDSLPTSYGYTSAPSNGVVTAGPARFMVGTASDPNFGKTTAIAYAQYYPTDYPTSNAAAVFQKLTLTLMLDYYYCGAETDSQQQFDIYEVTDSMLTYIPHYSNQSTPYGRLLGTATRTISPTAFKQNLIDNADADATNDISDSLVVTLDPQLGRDLLAASMDTVDNHENNYILFRKFRARFKGLAIVSPNSDKIVGFSQIDKKTRITLDYKIDTTKYQLVYRLDPPQQAPGVAEYTSYTEFRADRSGTPLAGLPGKYQEWEPADGRRYIQAGTGILTKLDFTEVFDYFKNIPTKALSVAELSIETDVQGQAPTKFLLRALKSNNRDRAATAEYFDAAKDPFVDIDATFVSKHMVFKRDKLWDKPYFRVDITGDDGGLFTLTQETGTGNYRGYLTNFLEQEFTNVETDFLRYYALVPQTPDIARGANGFYFPADKVKLKIYYTTPTVRE